MLRNVGRNNWKRKDRNINRKGHKVAGRKTSKKRQKKRGSSKNNKFSLFQKSKVLFLISFIALLFLAATGIKYFFYNSKLFEIKNVMVNKNNGYRGTYSKPKFEKYFVDKNIFQIDLNYSKLLIGKKHPQLKRMEIRKRFPDVIEIDFISRKPIAIIETGAGAVIDPEGVILDFGKKSDELIKIKGVGFFFDMPAKGEKIENPVIEKTLSLIKILKGKLHNNGRKIEYINISDKNNFLIVIDGVDVKMGKDDFSRKINDLVDIFNDPNMDVKDINYVDLRFSDPVIAPK